MSILQAVENVNNRQKSILFDKLCLVFDGDIKDKTIAVWGLAFKPETDDMREAPSLVVIDKLLTAGCSVKVYDPIAMDECRRRIGNSVMYADNMYDAAEGADAILLITEWKEFRMPSWSRVRQIMKTPVIIDGRNIYDKNEMSENGLISANDVAGKFFTRGKATSGSAITITMEGSRALSVEIQALVCESAYPKRSSTGYEKNRLDMLLALLERKLEIPLGHYDVFINVSGGVKIGETAADLAVVAAIISSFKNRPISKESVFMGELSLNGEIREIFNLDQRLKEAKTQKFKNAIVPSKPLDAQGLKCFVASDITQVLEWM